MSGFINTMFVSSTSHFPPAFPAKPKPLLPIFTFAQSQSCMNLRIDLEVLDFQERGLFTDPWSEVDCSKYGLNLARPKEVYQSPLQRIGEALRLQQTAREPISDWPCSTSFGEPQTPSDANRSSYDFSNYSYTSIPGTSQSTTEIDTKREIALGSGLERRDLTDRGNIISATPKSHAYTSRNNEGHFAGTSLLSSVSSNPRTRAPFKPQKSNRGTSSWQLKQYAEATLGSGSLRKAVKLPEGEDKDEWLAVNGRKIKSMMTEALLT
jgi:MOB kinase activator 1